MISGIFQISGDVLFWRVAPLTSEHDLGIWGDAALRRRAIGPIGPILEALPMHHGRPASLASPCRSRRVVSRPTA